MLHVLALLPSVLLLVPNVLAFNLTAPVQNEVIDSSMPFMVQWIPAQSDPSKLSIDIAYASSNNTYMLDSLATDVKISDGSVLIHWPADIPSNTDRYQLVFLNFSNDSLINHSDSFTLTGETKAVKVTQTDRGGLSAGDKAAIGILVPVGGLAVVALCYYILALCYYIHPRSIKQGEAQNALEKGDQPTGRAELEGNHRFTGFLHRFRTELRGSTSSDDVHDVKDSRLTELLAEMPNEMPAGNRLPVEMPAPSSSAVAPCAQEAAFPFEMPSPDRPTTAGGVGDIDNPSPSLTAGELSSNGGRRLSCATAMSKGVSRMMAKATNGAECAEIQTIGSGFIVTRKPVGTCRKEVPRHKPTRSTASAASSIMVGSRVESVDLRHDTEVEKEKGNENDKSASASSNFALDTRHDAQNIKEQPMHVSSSSESDARQSHDDHVGNAAEDEMTREPEGDIF